MWYNFSMPKQLVLASASQTRKEMLDILGLKYKVIPSKFEEDLSLKMPAEQLAVFLAKGKAMEVAYRVKNAVVVGADTLASFRGKVLGKPHTPKKAFEMLKMLSGQTHFAITGLCLVDTENKKTFAKAYTVKVTFRELSDSEIKSYIKTKQPLDKAGAYEIRGRGAAFVQRLEGEYTTAAGMPLSAFCEEVKKFGVKP